MIEVDRQHTVNPHPPQKKTLQSVTIVGWWVVIIVLIHLWQFALLLSSSTHIVVWTRPAIHVTRIIFALFWSSTWGWLSFALFSNRPNLHIKTAGVFILYTLYQVGLIRFSTTTIGRRSAPFVFVFGLSISAILFWWLGKRSKIN